MEDNKNGGFQFWPNYYKAIKRSTCPEKFALAIIEFFYEGKEHSFINDDDQFLFDLILPSIKCSKRNSERRQNGGGARPGNNYNPNGRRGKGIEQETSGDTTGEQEKEPNAGLREENDQDKPATSKRARKTFAPPTVDEVAQYAQQRGFKDPFNFACHFVDYYSQGESPWHLSNGKPMQDWKRAVITWEPNNKERVFSQATGTKRELKCGMNINDDY